MSPVQHWFSESETGEADGKCEIASATVLDTRPRTMD